jgi:hypothetical protein
MRGSLRLLPALACLAFPVAATAESGASLEDRVESLEERVRQLERALQSESRATAQPATDPRASAEEPEAERGRLHADYWLEGESPFKGEAGEPRTSGTLALPERLTLEPAEFDLSDTGPFSQWRNPARYPVAAVALRGRLVTGPGIHELVIRPQPVAEGGAGRRTRMQVRVVLDGETVLDTGLTDRWAEHRAEIPAQAGKRALTIEVLARGEGVGPSPTASAVLLRLKPPGAASPQPLADFVTPR